jgi:hypothetical protein
MGFSGFACVSETRAARGRGMPEVAPLPLLAVVFHRIYARISTGSDTWLVPELEAAGCEPAPALKAAHTLALPTRANPQRI